MQCYNENDAAVGNDSTGEDRVLRGAGTAAGPQRGACENHEDRRVRIGYPCVLRQASIHEISCYAGA